MISCTVFTENYVHTNYLNEMQTLSSAFSAPGKKNLVAAMIVYLTYRK